MKKIAILLAMLISVSGLTSCTADEPLIPTPSTEPSSKVYEPISPKEKESSEEEEPVVESSITVKVLGHSLTKDDDGNSVIIVDYEFSHTEEEAVSFMIAVSATLFQNGVELSNAYIAGDPNYDGANSRKDIKSGAVLTVQEAYVLYDETNEVEVEISELFADTFYETVITL